jgi:hypothetical protein
MLALHDQPDAVIAPVTKLGKTAMGNIKLAGNAVRKKLLALTHACFVFMVYTLISNH